jgi:hypothetical protein
MLTLAGQNGASLISLIILFLVLGIVSAAMVSMMNTENFNAMNQDSSVSAMNIAAGGIERALYQFKTGTNCAALTSGPVSLGSGNFTTTGTQFNPNPLTTLSGAMTNADTVIPVVNNVNYAPHGRIQIDSELIDYTGTSGTTQLIGARRGINGTTAAAHSNGASVLQAECLIRSAGTISNPLAGMNNTQRIIETGVEYSTHQGSFTKSTVGAPVNQSITGVGFQPKAVIFFWTRQAVNGFGPLATSLDAGVGFATAATERSVSFSANDDLNNSDEGRRYSESSAIIFLTGGGPPARVAEAALATMDPDGFTLNWTTNNNNSYSISYIALGGDITNAYAGTLSMTNAAGNQSMTGVGFQPDFVMFLWSYREGPPPSFNQNLSNGEIGLGFAKSSTSRGALVVAGRDNNGSNTRKRWQQRTDSVILLLNPTTNPPSQDAMADFVSMNPDGFTINKSNPPGNTAPIFFLALKGGNHQVGAFNQPALTGNQSVVGIGFRPEQLILASFNEPANLNVVGNGAISYGAARFPNARGSIWFQDRDDADNPGDANVYTNNGNLFIMADGNANSKANTGNPTINAQADFISFDRDGFTLKWITADATDRQILYWAIGPTVLNGTIDKEEIY